MIFKSKEKKKSIILNYVNNENCIDNYITLQITNNIELEGELDSYNSRYIIVLGNY